MTFVTGFVLGLVVGWLVLRQPELVRRWAADARDWLRSMFN